MALKNTTIIQSTESGNHVWLEEETLSDGSLVYAVIIKSCDHTQEIIISAINYKAARKLFDMLSNQGSDYFVD